MTRQEANRLIIKLLAEQVEKYPDIRFSQMMMNCCVVNDKRYEGEGTAYFYWVDEFDLEPTELLKRIQKAIKEYGL
jgi:hypothetical protein